MNQNEEILRIQKEAAERAIGEWTQRAAGPAHAEAIRAWATPTRAGTPTPPPAPAADRTAEHVSYYMDRIARTIGHIKERRGYSLYEKLPSGRGQWEGRHCGKEGCPCSHGQFRAQGDYCDRGFIPTPNDPDGVCEAARCPRCREHAETKAKAAP